MQGITKSVKKQGLYRTMNTDETRTDDDKYDNRDEDKYDDKTRNGTRQRTN